MKKVKSHIEFYKEATRIFTDYIPRKALINHQSNFLLFNNLQLNALLEVFPGVICILDFSTQQYLFVSNNIYSMAGYTPEEFYQEGIQKTISIFHPNHLDIIHNKILPTMFNCFEQHGDQVKNLRVSFNYSLAKKDGTYGWYHQQLTVIHFDEQQKAQIALMLLTDISEIKKGQTITLCISKKDSNGIFYPILTQNYNEETSILSIREAEILHLISQGKSSTEIAELLFISKNTVYNHRKKYA